MLGLQFTRLDLIVTITVNNSMLEKVGQLQMDAIHALVTLENWLLEWHVQKICVTVVNNVSIYVLFFVI